MIRRPSSRFCVLLVAAVLIAVTPIGSARAQSGPAVRSETRVATSTDDAEEDDLGAVSRASSDLEMVFNGRFNQVVGIRFDGVAVPPGAAILEAHIQFQVDETGSGAASLILEGEAADTAAPFLAATGDISSRPRTAASVSWNPPPWLTVGEAGPDQQTSDLSPILQEIVDRPGWSSGNALVVILTGTGERVAEAFDGDRTGAPLLRVRYLVGGNAAPIATITAPPDGSSVEQGDAVTLTGTATDAEEGDLSASLRWVSDRDGALGAGASVTRSDLSVGLHTITASVTDSGGATASDPIALNIALPDGSATVETRVAGSSDDAEEDELGAVSRASSDLEMAFDGGIDQVVGIRFTGVGVPPGAAILEAHIQFQVDETGSGAASLILEGEAADTAAPFLAATGDISSRPRTAASVSWNPPPWLTVGQAGSDQQTSDLSPILQEIVDRPGWSSGNALVVILTGTGERVAEAFDGDRTGAPLLRVRYRVGVNAAPIATITAPPDGSRVEQGDAVTLTGTATDAEDGDISDSLLWVLDRERVLGRGESVTDSELSVGVKTISAWVKDSDGLNARDQIALTVTDPQSPARAFPGAEGFGADAVGGRGGRVLEVTNLNDDGPGSFRAAVEASGPRLVVFRVGGTIELDSSIEIQNPYLTIAGQTAPGQGITLKNSPRNAKTPLKIETHEVIVRYIRSRPGSNPNETGTLDAITISNETEDVYNVIVDHSSFSWATDEVSNIYYAAHDITIQWSILGEGLDCATHIELGVRQCHSMGMLLGSQGSRNLSIHHNLFAHNRHRNPRIKTMGITDVVNNVVYNSGSGNGWHSPTYVHGGRAVVPVNYIANFFKPGPDSGSADWYIDTAEVVAVYIEGNIVPRAVIDPNSSDMVVGARHPAAPITTTSAFAAYFRVLDEAGASHGLNCDGTSYVTRDRVDERIVSDVKAGTGRIIDDPSEVGGWPNLVGGTPCADSDHDGMPDEFETLYGLDPTDASDGPADSDGDGYTNVEEFLNSTAPLR